MVIKKMSDDDCPVCRLTRIDHVHADDKAGEYQYIDKDGYYRYRSNDKLIHRVIAEGLYEYPLHGLVVHHKNHNKLDNRPDNLQVMTKEAHDELHAADLDDDYEFDYDDEEDGGCVICGYPTEESHHEYCTSCWFDKEGY